jgi:hypothetical protein
MKSPFKLPKPHLVSQKMQGKKKKKKTKIHYATLSREPKGIQANGVAEKTIILCWVATKKKKKWSLLNY